ncbi:MAG TPA: diguanylate cyclase [Candidatus Baltobacteraceae bacterium]|nr:diguanylate cyclase [Candidatus Baltobacteraceae bacterium]
MHQHHVEHRFTQLVSLIDLGLLEASPREQLRRILGECAFAVGADFAEVCMAHERCVAVAQPFAPPLPESDPLALTVERPSAPVTIALTDDLRFANHPVVRTLRLASMVVWPLQPRGEEATLALAWSTPRSTELTEEEMAFMNFLATVVTRLLEAHEKQRTLNERIDHDSLTGLHNRAALLERLGEAVSAAQRNKGEVAVLYVDLDRFKAINDTYGHSLGDAALAEVGRRMMSVLRKHEIGGRIGGDEFAIIVAPLGDRSEVTALSQRLLRALCAPMTVRGVALNISASMGVGVFPHDAASAQDLIAFADDAMYAAKKSGVSILTHTDHAVHVDEQPGVVDPALFDSHYVLCVQPIVDARSKRTTGGEILARWLDPHAGMLQPHAFLNGAHGKPGTDLDKRTLQLALRKSAAISRQFGKIQLFVNIDEADHQIFEVNDANNGISLELPEERVASDPDRFIAFIKACRSAGFGVGISRFGASDMTLRTLARLELDFVKINVQRLSKAGIDVNAPRAVRTIVDHARSVAPVVIAESIESQAETGTFVAAGVDALQGYSICSPLTVLDFEQWLRYKGAG